MEQDGLEGSEPEHMISSTPCEPATQSPDETLSPSPLHKRRRVDSDSPLLRSPKKTSAQHDDLQLRTSDPPELDMEEVTYPVASSSPPALPIELDDSATAVGADTPSCAEDPVENLVNTLNAIIIGDESSKDVLLRMEESLQRLCLAIQKIQQQPRRDEADKDRLSCLYENLATLIKNANKNIITLFLTEATSVKTLAARLPILEGFRNIAIFLFATVDFQQLEQWGLGVDALLDAVPNTSKVLGPLTEQQQNSHTAQIIARDELRKLPRVIGAAWFFTLGIRLLYSDEAPVMRFGAYVLARGTASAANAHDAPFKATHTRLLCSYLSANDITSLIFNPLTTPAVVQNCDSLMCLLAQTAHLQNSDLQRIWDRMNSSPNVQVRYRCEMILGRLGSGYLDSKHIAALLQIATTSPLDKLQRPAFMVINAYVLHLHKTNDPDLWNSTIPLLITRLQEYLMPSQIDDGSECKIEHPSPALDVLVAIFHCRMPDNLLAKVLESCLERLKTPNALLANCYHVLRVIILCGHGQLVCMGRMREVERVAVDALESFLDDAAEKTDAEQATPAMGGKHYMLVQLVLLSITQPGTPCATGPNRLWTCIGGKKALRDPWRNEGLSASVGFAAKSKVMAGMVHGWATNRLQRMHPAFASRGLIHLTSFLMAYSSLDVASVFCVQMVGLMSQLDDEALVDDLAMGLVKAINVTNGRLRLVEDALAHVLYKLDGGDGRLSEAFIPFVLTLIHSWFTQSKQRREMVPLTIRAFKSLETFLCDKSLTGAIRLKTLRLFDVFIKEYAHNRARWPFYGIRPCLISIAIDSQLASFNSDCNSAVISRLAYSVPEPSGDDVETRLPLLISVTLNAAVYNQTIFQWFVDNPRATSHLERLLDHADPRKVDVAASSLETCLASLPDFDVEAKINPPGDATYTPDDLLRSLEVKVRICRIGLNALGRNRERFLRSPFLIKFVAEAFRQKAVRDALPQIWLQACFEMVMDHMCAAALDANVIGELDANISWMCSLARSCANGLSKRGTKVKVSGVMLECILGLLFVPKAKGEIAKNHPVLTRSDTRTSVYRLLRALYANGVPSAQMFDFFNHVFETAALSITFSSFGRDDLIRKPYHPMGLENLSQTCYVNSLIQQLFHNPRFRSLIRDAPDSLHDTTGVVTSLRAMFQTLEHGCERSSKPISLCEALGVDIHAQEDVSLYFQDLMSRVESALPDEAWKTRLRSMFMGLDASQTIGECGHVSERSEQNLVLPLAIKGHENLHQSLDAYVAGCELDETEPFKCEKCQESGKQHLVRASRRTRFRDIPNDLVINLMRFEFNSCEGGQKIYDRFAFPPEIDLAPYTLDAAANPSEPLKQDIFELVGVIVHQGSLNIGHYWSYVRTEGEGNTAPRWFRMEDSEAREVDLGEVLTECAGGSVKTRGGFRPRVDSAFVLFYRRKNTALPTAPFEEQIPTALAAQNAEIEATARLFDDGLYNLICDLLIEKPGDLRASEPETEGLPPAVLLALEYLRDISCHDASFDKIVGSHRVTKLCCFISMAVQNKPRRLEAMLDILLDEWNAPKLFFGPLARNRIEAGSLLLRTLDSLRICDPIAYGNAEPLNWQGCEAVGRRDIFVETINKLEAILKNAERHPLAWRTFFDLLEELHRFGPMEARNVLKSRFTEIAILFTSFPSHPYLREEYPALAFAWETFGGEVSFKPLVKFLDQVLDPSLAPLAFFFERTLVDDTWNTRVVFSEPPRGGYEDTLFENEMLHFAYNVCCLCTYREELAPDGWPSTSLIVKIFESNRTNSISSKLWRQLLSTAENSRSLTMFFAFASPLRLICLNTNISAQDKTMFMGMVIYCSSQHGAIALFAIELAKELMPHCATPFQVSAYYEWIVTTLLEMPVAVKRKMLVFLKEAIFKPSLEAVVFLSERLRTTASLIDLLEFLSGFISEAMEKSVRRCRYAIAAFFLAVEQLKHRYERYLDFRNPRHLEQMLGRAYGDRERIDEEANTVHRISRLMRTAERFMDSAVAAQLDVYSLMTVVVDRESSVEESEEEFSEVEVD